MYDFFHDVPPDVVASAFARGERYQSGTVFARWLPLPPWPTVPTRFLLCQQDRFFPAEFMRRVVRDRPGIVPDEFDSGHLPALRHPRALVGWLESYRGDVPGLWRTPSRRVRLCAIDLDTSRSYRDDGHIVARVGHHLHTSGRRDLMAEETLYERLGGMYNIAGAVDVLVDRLYDNASANMNPEVKKFHDQHGHAGFKFLVTAWSVENTGGPKCYPGRDMKESHAHLNVSEHDFDVVALEIASTLSFLGVPEREHRDFMDLIESYRAMVVA